jgi:2-polyprenyl-6-methoxyphenol hydroxylase-like FAD-dependent oxidoreductase
MSRDRLRALVIGGGVGGPALALFLHKAGIGATVYEAQPVRGAAGGIALAPNGVNVLKALGLTERLKSRGSLAFEHCFRNEDGRVLARYDNGSDRYGAPAVGLRRSDLSTLLTEEMTRRGIALERSKRLVGIEQTRASDTVTAHFADGSSATGDILVGADGVQSQTRRCVLPEQGPPDYAGIVGIGGVVPGACVHGVRKRDRQSFNFTLGHNGYFGYCGAHGGDMIWWSSLRRECEPTFAEIDAMSLDEVKDELECVYAAYHEPIPALIEHTRTLLKRGVYELRPLRAWHRGRVALIGDAAHAARPTAGQGASVALEDAMYLAKLLGNARGEHDAAFARYEAERKHRVQRILATGSRRARPRAMLSPLESMLRNAAVAVGCQLFGVRMQDWMYGYRIGWPA